MIRKTKLVNCDVCGQPIWIDQYGNGDECPVCGWRQSEESAEHPNVAGILNIPSLNSARELYRQGKPFIADFTDFIEACENYGEVEFTYKQIRYGVWGEKGFIVLHERITGKTIGVYTSMEDFKNNAKINGILLKDLWTFVENTDFLQG
ncbi:MAG: CPCC family cysteine-rich protein [Clostridia bacterium]|nr:CPCC family cysteine-rich protein [Clostridia bacterium]